MLSFKNIFSNTILFDITAFRLTFYKIIFREHHETFHDVSTAKNIFHIFNCKSDCNKKFNYLLINK